MCHLGLTPTSLLSLPPHFPLDLCLQGLDFRSKPGTWGLRNPVSTSFGDSFAAHSPARVLSAEWHWLCLCPGPCSGLSSILWELVLVDYKPAATSAEPQGKDRCMGSRTDHIQAGRTRQVNAQDGSPAAMCQRDTGWPVYLRVSSACRMQFHRGLCHQVHPLHA